MASSLRLLFSLTLLTSLFFGLAPSNAKAASDKPSAITIGFIPGESPESLRENGAAIAKMLESKLQVPVKIFVSNDYNGLVDAMKEKKVDFAFLSAMTFVFAEKAGGAKVLLKKVWDGPYYYSTLLVRRDSKISKLSQLKGKKIALVDQKSASGYLYPKVYFKKQHIEPEKFFSEVVYSGNHEESARLLKEKKVDAIAVFSNDAKAKDTAWNRFGDPKNPKAVKPLWVSEPIPNDPFCVRRDFYDKYPKVSHDLMFALIELDDGKDSATFKKLLHATSLMLATSQQYDPVREMVRELDLAL
jgi:phosphonate transport system substrate-binding protein